MDGDPKLCWRGFHACTVAADCFDYYSFGPMTVLAEVECYGRIDGPKEDCSKIASTGITIIREITQNEIHSLVNSGHRNSGHRNSGHRNSGDWNSGDWNSGDWNSCNGSNGYFNSIRVKCINVFNKPCDIDVWKNSKKPDFIFFDLTVWVDSGEMTEEEKNENKGFEIAGGYLKKLKYKEAWKISWDKANDKDKGLLYALPNFDPVVFKEITGIDVTKDATWKPLTD
jgi:hypothetical protein